MKTGKRQTRWVSANLWITTVCENYPSCSSLSKYHSKPKYQVHIDNRTFLLLLFLSPCDLCTPNHCDHNDYSRGPQMNPNFPRCVQEAIYQQSKEEAQDAV